MKKTNIDKYNKRAQAAYDSITLSLYYFEKFIGILNESGVDFGSIRTLMEMRTLLVDLREPLKVTFSHNG